MRILVLNPNTSEAMTAEIDAAAGSYLSAVGVMDVVAWAPSMALGLDS